MNFKRINLLLLIIGIALISCAQQSNKKEINDKEMNYLQKDQVVELISPFSLNEKLGDIQLIDIRTPREYAGGYIKGADNINYYNRNFIDQMSKLDKNKALYIYCRSGNRSGSAAKRLEAVGFTKIYDLQGGIISWQRNNLEIVK